MVCKQLTSGIDKTAGFNEEVISMKQIAITKTGGPEVLEYQSVPIPVPGQNEVLIEVKAAGVNFADILIRRGLYPDPTTIPMVPGFEVAGTVVESGNSIEEKIQGKDVIAFTKYTGYAEYVTAERFQVFDKPAHLSFEEAAALPVNYLTAYQLLVIMCAVKAGETVLIHNAGGGVGLAAFTIAKHAGATVYGTASMRKHHTLYSFGYDHLMTYNGWEREVRDKTNGQGVDTVLDSIGGSHWRKSYKALGSGGRLGMYGMSCACKNCWWAKAKLLGTVLKMPWFHPVGLRKSNRGVFGVHLGEMWDESEKIKQWMQAIIDGIEEKSTLPYLDKVFNYKDAGLAHNYLESRQNIGKVVLVPGQ
jgi:NADPH:quinone reductase-like Zn-dependent oxidoreductase